MREREREREREQSALIGFQTRKFLLIKNPNEQFQKSEILAGQDFLNSNGQFMCNERERRQSALIGFFKQGNSC